MRERRGPTVAAVSMTLALAVVGCDRASDAGTSATDTGPALDTGRVDSDNPTADPTAPPDARNQAVSIPSDVELDCSADGLGADDVFSFSTAHYVVDGALGEVCLGDEDPRLVAAWDALSTIAPAGQLADLGIFTAFEADETGDEITLAFVNTLDDDGTSFQMSVNLESYVDDPDEALLTIAHEFAHVFTAMPTQIDRTVEASDDCDTWDNGEGCFVEDSLMFQWIETFWGDGLIEEIDPFEEPTGAEGEARCNDDPGFFGPYAASHPEEDFAETFSAYVFDLEPATPEQQDRLDWIAAQPGLVEFRDRAEAAGLTPVPNSFGVCGLDK